MAGSWAFLIFRNLMANVVGQPRERLRGRAYFHLVEGGLSHRSDRPTAARLFPRRAADRPLGRCMLYTILATVMQPVSENI